MSMTAPDPGLDPIHDGVGKFIRAAVGMEETTSIALGIITGEGYLKFERQKIEERLTQWLDIAAELPNPHREQLMAAVDAMRSTYELRHGVVHGIGLTDGMRIQSQRPDRRAKGDQSAPFTKVTYSHESLLAAARRAGGVRSFIWSNMESWREQLGWAPGDEG